ncbi:MAG TPA: TetR/AcrR family transcriptional regulator [Polyangiaceae bacterium]|nr:TetR/AcrR family transcriptional regulator [Polyangiaceae bacterium]
MPSKRSGPRRPKKAPRGTRSKAAPAKPRLSRTDWIHGAYEALGDRGISAITVDALAQRLGVTKGSFYWHFRDSEDLLGAVVAHWEELAVDRVLGDLLQLGSPCAVIRRIISHTVGIDEPERRLRYRVEAVMAAMAEWHPIVRPVYTRVMQRRLNGLSVLYLATGMSAPEAARAGELAVVTLVGVYPLLMSRPLSTQADADRLTELLCDRLLPARCKEAPEPA